MTACTSCQAALSSALVCEACGALQAVETGDPWAAFGIERAFAHDDAALKKRLLTLQRHMHPDFFGGADASQRELAERNTAELNAAHRVLKDDARRADLLVRLLGGPDEEAERQMPQAFLMEVLEWNEALDEARESAPDSPKRAALDGLEQQLKGEREDALERVARALSPLPDPGAPALGDVRRELNAVRYLDRTLSTLAELRLDAARSTN